MAVYYEPFANPWHRAMAFVIDSLATLIPTFLLYRSMEDVGDEGYFITAGAMVLHAAYYIGFGIARGATPGKAVFRMKVVALDGGTPSPDVFILRYLVFLLTTFVPLGAVISFLFVLGDPERRAVHDRIAGTTVVSA